MGSAATEPLQLPKIDMTGLEPGSPGWDAARSEVMAALETYGCFEAIYAEVSQELRDALFGHNMPELFGLPLEVKKRNITEISVSGYLGGIPGMAYESLIIDSPWSVKRAEEFTRLMWPQGNPGFRDTIGTYSKHMKDLEQMVVRMVFQSMNVEKYCQSHLESTNYIIRLSEYGVPLDLESKIAMPTHVDPNFVTVVCQHQVEGLEVQTRDGDWIPVMPSPNSFTVMIGETFEVWSNGRLQGPKHRVQLFGAKKRYSALLSSQPEGAYVIHAPKELVDEEHPLLHKPFNFNNYVQFRFSEKGVTAENPLKAFCSARGEEEQA